MGEIKTILIAEDEKPMANALAMKLTNEGFIADVAGNGEIALKMLGEKKYDLLVLDLMMPKVDGFTVLEELKNQSMDIAILVASNLSQDDDIKRVTDLGARDFYVKSNTSLSEIVKKIKSLEV